MIGANAASLQPLQCVWAT